MRLRFPIRLLKFLENTQVLLDEPLEIEKIEEGLTPNMRALRLAMSMADELASRGVAVSDVVHMCLGITNTYCKRKVHIDVSSSIITVSQDRGNDREPLTLIRTFHSRMTNYTKIQALQRLALRIRDRQVRLSDAEKELDAIVQMKPPFPLWFRHFMSALVGMGVVILYSGTPLLAVLAFIMGFMASYTSDYLSRQGLMTFFIQVLVSLGITLISAAVVWLNVEFSLNVNPTLLLVGGIVMLVAGMMIVGAFQDAIDEYYVTANARLLKVAVATGGIVIGVLIGLYIANNFGITFPATPTRMALADQWLRYLGAFFIAFGFAASNYATRWAIFIAGFTGLMSFLTLQVMMDLGLNVIVASGIAAGAVGLMGTFGSRFWNFPSIAIISAGIVPLVPGLSLYNGLMSLVEFPFGSVEFVDGLSILARAIAIGIAVAAGASAGNMIGRPLRRRMIYLSNKLPRRRLSKEMTAEDKLENK